MICMMCVFIWIFTQLHFYLIDDSYVGQKYGIEFSCQFRCRNMSCETISVSTYSENIGKKSISTLSERNVESVDLAAKHDML